MQHLTTKGSLAGTALSRLFGAHAALTRELSAQLVEEHGLTLSEYEVLLLLSHAPTGMRRIDLAREVRLSASGVTRMLDRLEATGLVEKGSCASDARVTYAVLTDAGLTKLREAADSHVAAVQALFEERYSEDELGQLGQLLARLPGAEGTVDESCTA